MWMAIAEKKISVRWKIIMFDPDLIIEANIGRPIISIAGSYSYYHQLQ